MKEYITLKDICEDIGISLETGKNWEKLGKITPDKEGLYSKEYLSELKQKIDDKDNDLLKGRRNKKYLSGKKSYESYVLWDSPNRAAIQKMMDIISREDIDITAGLLEAIIADLAIQLTNESLVKKIFDISVIKIYKKKYSKLFSITFEKIEKEDTLGLIYQSCNDIKNRKAKGSYYTPTNIVKKLISQVFQEVNVDNCKKICDPCCGTGNFLLQLPDTVSYTQVYGNDIDELAVKIARVNFAIRYKIDDIKILEEHITNKDFLTNDFENFDILIGNPPWGSEFDSAQKDYLKKSYKTAKRRTLEAYDLVTEKALSIINEDGIVAFVLPEAVLNVKTHRLLRELLLDKTCIKSICYIGNVFEKIQCPCVLLTLQLKPNGFTTKGICIENKEKAFQINTDRSVTSECFSFYTDDEEYKFINDITNSDKVTFLKDNAVWGLGIVSGNNKELISKASGDDKEPILKGSDIYKYIYRESGNYIQFVPESFQQVAPTSIYRAKEKLIYRFINNNLIFAYDNKKRITLNSCNILIPMLKGIDIKYVMAVLNSKTAQFIFKKKYNSVKVLRSHLEEIPIPIPTSEEQGRIVKLVDRVLENTKEEEREVIIEEIEMLVENLYEKSRIN